MRGQVIPFQKKDESEIQNPEELVILSGNANLNLAEKVCKILRLPLGKVKVGRFADGEVRIKINENIRNKAVFVIQSTHPPAEHWEELCFLLDAARRASAKELTAVIPYCGYSRQERKDEPRVSISLKVKLDQIVLAGADRVVSVDLHAAATQGFVNIPFDNLFATPLLLERFISFFENHHGDTCLVTDLGYAKVCGAYAKRLDLELVIARKVRPEPNALEDKIDLIGNVKENAIFIDDLADTFKTAKKIGEALKKRGTENLAAAMIHPVLSKSEKPEQDALTNMINSPFDRFVFSDTIPVSEEKQKKIREAGKKLDILSVSPLLAASICAIYEGGSVSEIFDQGLERLRNLVSKPGNRII